MTRKGKFKFSDYLRQLRKMRQLTLEKAAEESGVSAGYISMLETGKKEYPTAKTLKKLAKAYNIPHDQLLTMIGYITEQEERSGGEKRAEDASLFIFDLKGLTDEDIKDLEKQIELLKLRAQFKNNEKKD